MSLPGILEELTDSSNYADLGRGLFDLNTYSDGLRDLLGITEPKLPNIKNNPRANVRSNMAALPVVYGRVFVGGAIVYAATANNNQDLHLIVAVAEGEVLGEFGLYLDDVLYSSPQWGGLASFTFYDGTDAQTADGDMLSAFPGIWTSNHRLRGVAYAHVKLTYNKNYFRGIPQITFDLAGRLLYDPRTSTTSYSTNPALAIRDYLTNARYGKGLPTSAIDDTSIIAAANFCDENVQHYSGDANPSDRYTCNGVVDTSRRIIDNLRDLLRSCNGHLIFSNGKYKLLIEDTASSVFTFTTANILGGWKVQSVGKAAMLNRVTARYHHNVFNDRDNEAVYDDATLRSSADNGALLETGIALPFVNDPHRAYRIAQLVLLKSRLKLRIAFVATIEALKLDVGEVVSITHATPGWSGKLFRVTQIDLRPDGNIGIRAEEYAASAYSVQLPGQFAEPAATNLPNPFTVAVPTALTLASGTAHLLVSGSGDVISRIYASWTAPADPYVIGYDVEAKKSAESIWLPVTATHSKDSTAAYIAPVLDGVNYDVRVRAVNSLGRFSSWVTSGGHSVVGKTEAPPSVLSFTYARQADGTRVYEWSYGTLPPDMGGFRLYWKADSGGSPPALGTMTRLKGAELTPKDVRLHESNQLPADTYWLACVAVDTTGNESTPVYIQVDMDEPRLENAILQVNEHPAWSGTKTSCFAQDGVLYANANYTWSSLTTWTAWTAWNVPSVSPIVYQTGSVDVGAVLTFTPLISAAVIGSKTLEIRTSNDNTNWSSWTAYVAQTVTVRYLQVKITVTGTTPTITALSTIITAPVVEEFFNDIDCSSSGSVTVQSTGVIKLNLTKSYATITYVNPVMQNIGASDEWKATVTGKATSGPVITFYKKISGTWTLTTPTSSTPVDFYVRGA